jgi:hypothetical protein
MAGERTISDGGNIVRPHFIADCAKETDRDSPETPTSIDVNNPPEEPQGGGEGKAVPWEATM